MQAYFNNSATTFPKPCEVYDFMDNFYRTQGGNASRGFNGNIINQTRDLLLELFHCSNKKVVFTHTATEAINIILQGLDFHENSNIYISPFEHNAVVRVLKYLEKTKNINIFTLSVKDFTYNLADIENHFSENPPNAVIISHASNVCGLIAPIVEICSLSYKYKSINIIDMCQTAGLIDTDISSDIYSFIIFAGHKTLYAPFGVSGFICKENSNLKPLIYGGTGVDSANEDVPSTIPERFEVGTQNTIAIAGLFASLQWINNTKIETIYKKEQENLLKLRNILEKHKNISIISPKDNVIGVVSVVFDDYSSDNIGQVLNEQGIEVRTGLHCSPNAHKYLNTFPAGTVRFSVGYFNTDEDFDKLDKALNYILENS